MDEIIRMAKLLNSETRLRIISIIGNSALDVPEITRIYNQKFTDKKYRETIYRHLEEMVEGGLIKKSYSQKDKKLKYVLKKKKMIIDLNKIKY